MKPLEANDPWEIVAVPLPEGDPDYMVECLIEEYVLLGWNHSQLMSLFTRPFFSMTHQIYLEKGEAYVRSMIRTVNAKWRTSST